MAQACPELNGLAHHKTHEDYGEDVSSDDTRVDTDPEVGHLHDGVGDHHLASEGVVEASKDDRVSHLAPRPDGHWKEVHDVAIEGAANQAHFFDRISDHFEAESLEGWEVVDLPLFRTTSMVGKSRDLVAA